MTQEPKPPRNQDQDLPARRGDRIDPSPPPKDDDEAPKKQEPLPEEESYERDSPSRNTDEERISNVTLRPGGPSLAL
jgi:hypothetical protein